MEDAGCNRITFLAILPVLLSGRVFTRRLLPEGFTGCSITTRSRLFYYGFEQGKVDQSVMLIQCVVVSFFPFLCLNRSTSCCIQFPSFDATILLCTAYLES
jgi:hypothetical protein